MEDTSDTLRLAAEERAKQGIHELEFSFGGEVDLHTHFKTCEKNPGHRMFIPVNELNTSHLPEHIATDKIIAWIRRMSYLTVKLSVHYVSPNRPPGFPLSDRRGQRVLSVGSGYVTDYPRGGEIEEMPCPFTNCADLPGDHEVFGYITITTAAHVVFDDEEAKNTTVEFFYDDPDDRRHAVTARGMKVGASSVEGDFCELLCVTHNISLISKLKCSYLKEHNIDPTDPFFHTLIMSLRYRSHQLVKLAVHYVSPNRPPGYTSSNRRGQRVLSVGSGYVTECPREGDIDKMPCPFTNCADLPGDHEVFGYITITTAAHVVFDDEEAKNTTVEFFYDDPDDKRHVVTARGVKMGTSTSRGGYFVELLCVTHDTFFIRQLTYNVRTVQTMRPIDYNYIPDEMIRFTPHQIVKLSVNYVSPNRPPGYPLSDLRGQRVLFVGNGRLTGVSLEGNDGQLPCPFTNYANIPRYKFPVYITIATAAHVVFDDEEAKNTTVEFFYDHPDVKRHVVTARGLKVRYSNKKDDLCELVCVTDDELFGQLKDNYLRWSVAQKKRFCDLFRTALPGLEIQCEKENGFKFIIKIRLSNPSEAVETLTILTALTGKMVDSVFMHWDFSKNSLQDVLESARCQTQYMHTLILCELHIAKLVDKSEKTTPFLHLEKTLWYMLGTLPISNIDSPQICRNILSSVKIELAKYYSTVEIMKERLYASSYFTEFYSRNVQKVVDISNDTATVEVTFHKVGHFTTLRQKKMVMNYFERDFERDYNQWKSNDTEYQPDLLHFRGDECQSVAGIKIPVDHLHFSRQYVCELCNRKCKPEDNQCKPGYCKYKPQDSKYKSEDSKCNKDDIFIIHIGHPHGQSKRVTIGRQIDCWTGHGFYHQLYTAPTCPGCSGGPVWMIPASGDLNLVYGVPHHGHYGNQVNSGCSWTMYPEKCWKSLFRNYQALFKRST